MLVPPVLVVLLPARLVHPAPHADDVHHLEPPALGVPGGDVEGDPKPIDANAARNVERVNKQ